MKPQAQNATQALVLSAIRQLSPVSRAEIARHAELSPPTVSQIVGHLVDQGLVEEIGRRASGRGQPSIQLRIRARAAFTIGLALEHASLTGVLADLDGTVLADRCEDLVGLDPEYVLERLADMCRELHAAAHIARDRILGIGLASFGPLDVRAGTVNATPFASTWDRVPLRSRLADAVGLPVFLDNNATAAAIGEHWYGVAQGYRDFFLIFIGLGVGGGLFLNGKVHRGVSFNAGEVGHTIVAVGTGPDGRTGGAHTLEAFISLGALARDLGDDAVENLSARFRARNAAMMAWLDAAAERLAHAAVTLDSLLDLDAVVIGGLLPAEVVDYLVQRAATYRDGLFQHGRPHHAELLSGQTGAGNAALGAAMLPVYDAFLLAPSVGPTLAGVFSSPPAQGGDRLS